MLIKLSYQISRDAVATKNAYILYNKKDGAEAATHFNGEEFESNHLRVFISSKKEVIIFG